MKLKQSARSSRPMIDMVPMINFAFLLLIFFVLAGKVGKHEAPSASLPHAASAVAAPAAADELQIGPDALVWNGEAIAEAQLLTRAHTWRAQHAGATLRVSAAGAAEAVRVLRVIEALRAAGIANLVLAAR